MPYSLVYSDGFERDVKKLDRSLREELAKKAARLKEQPKLSKPLHGSHNLFSERFAKHRLIFQVNDAAMRVLLLRVLKRDDHALRQFGYK